MLIIILSYLGGVLTILSPCILPVIPFIFARSDQSFYKATLPMLFGMAASFAVFAFLAISGGTWVVSANWWGRIIALVIFSILGCCLLFPRLSDYLFNPLVKLGNMLQIRSQAYSGIVSSFLIGLSLGLLWTPCAGPILGLVFATAALNGANITTFVLLLFFALGAATSLTVAIFASKKIINSLKKGFGIEEWLKRALGLIVLVSVAVIALGLDTKFLAKFSYLNTTNVEQNLINEVLTNNNNNNNNNNNSNNNSNKIELLSLAKEGVAPSLSGATQWYNSKPLDMALLKGKVVLIDFWTYSCINCLRTLPYLKDWSRKYSRSGLTIIGVHTPEFAFEKDPVNVKNAISNLKIDYPVALDNNHAIWNAYRNRYWPAHYIIDINGIIRHHHFGEGDYDETEKIIQQLLQEIPHNIKRTTNKMVKEFTGVEVQASSSIKSPETYLGYERQKGFVSTPNINENNVEHYKSPKHFNLNQWGFTGSWKIMAEKAILDSTTGTLTFKFKGRDLHLVMGSSKDRVKIKFLVTIDGNAPDDDHGEDVNGAGYGVVQSHRLYQLIRKKDNTKEHVFKIRFLAPGVEVFAFTFG